MQITIEKPVSCYGIGIHSAKPTHLILKPGKADSGIVFIRTDVKSGSNIIPALWSNVNDTMLSTSIKNENNISVSTIEHLMAAIWGCNIDNLIVELDGPEVPIMDGSSKSFIFMIECAGIKLQKRPKKYLKILKEIRVLHKDCEIIASPADNLDIDLTINFVSKAIGKQQFIFSNDLSFKDEVSQARSFGFLHELDYLKNQGLALGASLDNAIGIDNDTILNKEGLRYENEFARHKLLDMLGDLYTSGGLINGKFNAYKPSHQLNNQFLKTLFTTPYAYEYVSKG